MWVLFMNGTITLSPEPLLSLTDVKNVDVFYVVAVCDDGRRAERHLASDG